MLSWRKTKLRAVLLHQSRLTSLFRGVLLLDAIEVTGTQSRASLQHGLAGKTVLYNARNPTVLSTLRTVTTFHVWSIKRTEAFSTISGSILLQARDPAKLNEEIQIAVDEHRCDEAWRLFEQHMQMEGFPRKSVVNNVLVCFAESLDSNWLQKGYTLVEQAYEESKQNLLEKEPLLYLSLALAKSGMAVPASTILRKLVETEEYPHVSSWSAVLGHMSLAGSGSYLSAELVLEIGYLFQNNRVDPRKKSNASLLAMKPNTQALNIALAGCLLFGTTRKAEQLLDMIPKIGVKADANLLVIMAHIYERNGRREELRKLQRHIDEACNLNDSQFWQFYNCLLMCHLKFGDLESASKMVLEMLRRGKVARNSLGAAILGFDTADDDRLDLKKVSGKGSEVNEHDIPEIKVVSNHSMIPYDEFSRDRKFLKLEAEAKDVLGSLLSKLRVQVKLITSKRGVLQPTEEIYVKLAKAFLESGKMKELAEFLLKAEHEDSPVSSDNSMLVNVINACISLGMLDQAHDLLDEMRMAGARTGSSVYSLLLKAYCKTNRTREVTSLLRDAQKAGIQLDSSCYEALIQSQVIQNDTHGALNVFKEMKEAKIPRGGNQQFEKLLKGCEGNAEAGLMSKLLREIREGQSLDAGVHDWNNVIHLMQDAEKALTRMRTLVHSPNAQTFHSMVTGYAAIGSKYTEVTELWGEMKSIAAATSLMRFDQELLDAVLYTFVRGGFFSRANEVVEMIEKKNMFVDKYKYRMLFLKYHKTAYKGKAPKVQSESQLKKREAGLVFKKWLGLS
ncbi:PREDICTED: pentatricopeptide repeat-containing protein At1g03100, mitochondrial isoform X2 [Camelina sativa]|uniref:Pentatricopeptide repeat-containing protein At1g03100, mitochondrial isoform X2 n=1 Tax=Camelina sativa TaxID=90675 RepID=A0ABM0WR03_CAMSA|nr:PREDICTED: pentatricopeptide repeat-containing protein At1g03100, mitochondrial isoform X2 [Camelina sativa]